MKKRDLSISYSVASGIDELTPQERELFEKAVEAMQNAYAPYSEFHVGAAALLSDGRVVTGSNQENMAYPSGLCAERVALFSAAANFPDEAVEILAIAANPAEQSDVSSVSPCGSCRQVMIEYERKQNRPIRILSGAASGPILLTESAGALLPFAFYDVALGRRKP